jgi:hypothetical protein
VFDPGNSRKITGIPGKIIPGSPGIPGLFPLPNSRELFNRENTNSTSQSVIALIRIPEGQQGFQPSPMFKNPNMADAYYASFQMAV